MKPRTRKIVKRIMIALLLLVLAGVSAAGLTFVWVRSRLTASLPRLDGELAVAGLTDTVVVERDADGVPTLRGRDRGDVSRALGFLHAQERFFQMDLLRRRAAGELAELFGEAVVATDRDSRRHRFRARAEVALERAGPETRAWIAAYSDGVNAGLAALGEAPPEYFALRVEPRRWEPADTMLAVMAMYFDLQGYLWSRESDRGVMYDVLPHALADFLAPLGTEWDAPIEGEVYTVPPIPGPDVYDLRKVAVAAGPPRLPPRRTLGRAARGSNSWAVAAAHSRSGAAIVANDMHLGLGLPNVWYRVVMVFAESDGAERRLVGVTLPGVPALVVGSNGDVAWGFTNSYGDWADLVILENDPQDANRYMTPDGSLAFRRHAERIAVKGADAVVLEVLETIWGPVIDEDHLGRRRALRWVAHFPRATDLDFFDLERARNLEQALDVAARSGLPAQNFVVGDRGGRIAWTIAGPIPARDRRDRTRPVPWSEAGRWDRWLEPPDYPRIVDPAAGRVWTANNRVVAPPQLDAIGDGGFAHGARAGRIRSDLAAASPLDEAAMLAIQLDDRSPLLDRWRELLLEVLDPRAVAEDARRGELRRIVERPWDGRAAVESASYRMVRGFRSFVATAVFSAITAACLEADEHFDYDRTTNQSEGPLWRLVTERPSHLLSPEFADWRGQLLAAVDAMLDYFAENHDGELDELTWGRRNTVRIGHPLSLAVPALSRWLDMPPTQLPGDVDVPRVQGTHFGASERLVVSPGREESGIFHMPGGQSGHPLSPFYRAGHAAWVQGSPSPLLPRETRHRLQLSPADASAR